MKGAVTAVTQSYISVPRTVNIHQDICLEFYADVQGIKDAVTTATTAKRFCFSVTVQLYILIFRVIERYTDIYEA